MLDVAPVIAIQEDLHFLSTGMKNITERHGEDYGALRKKMESIYKLDQWDKPLNGGQGISLALPRERSALVEEAGLYWLRSYFAIVEKREKESYGKEEKALRDSIWARILAYYFLGDKSVIVGVKLGAPIDALTLGFLPPTIRY
jgi:coproporphyrinogen III oxidase